jgi:hypothetical protein
MFDTVSLVTSHFLPYLLLLLPLITCRVPITHGFSPNMFHLPLILDPISQAYATRPLAVSLLSVAGSSRPAAGYTDGKQLPCGRSALPSMWETSERSGSEMAAVAMVAYKESFLLRLCQILWCGCPIKAGSQPANLLSCSCLPSFKGLDWLPVECRRAGPIEVSYSIEVKH